jgi:hypothetical protein
VPAILPFIVGFFALLALALARWGTNPKRVIAPPGESPMPSVSVARLRELVVELLEAMGMTVTEFPEDPGRFVATFPDPILEARYLVTVEGAPAADVVEQPAILELAEQVRDEVASAGMLVTPYAIDRSGLTGFGVPIELIDGPRLRALIARYLPARLPEVDGYRGFGREAAPEVTQPAFERPEP